MSVQLTGSYPPITCGIGDYTHRLVESLAELGTESEVWTRRIPGAPASARPIAERWDSQGARDLLRALARERPRLVHLQFETSVWNHNARLWTLLPLAARRIGAALVTTLHSLDGPPRWKRAHRAALLPLLLGSQDLVVCSQRQLGALGRLPVIGRRVRLIPIGSTIAVSPNGQKASGPLRLIYFGFVWRGRNIETLLRALGAASEIDRNATLEIVGGIRDDEYRRELTDRAARLGVAERVCFRGDLPDDAVSRALGASDIALLPFATGASTGRTTLMAALAHRLPVVTYGVPDNLSPLFEHKTNLMLAPAGDEDAFVAHVRDLAADAALRARIAEGAGRLAEAFSWPRIARSVLDLPSYRRLAG